jgi:hypothetical protein
MSIRILVLYVAMIGLSVYAWKDWFKSLCGLLVLTSILEYPDMPRTLGGIPGMNLWNVLFGVVLLAWVASRRRRQLTWDMPRHMSILVWIYVGIIIVGAVRAIFDRGKYTQYPVSSIIMDELITTLKWIVPAILLFDGCRTRKQAVAVLGCLVVLYVLFALQAIKWMPWAAIRDSSVLDHARMKLGREIGFHCADVSVMLAGASWGILAVLQLVRGKLHKVLLLGMTAVVIFGQALTGGRGGYLAWGATGLMLCLLKWRKYLLLAPVMVVLLPVVFPGATARMLEGFGQTDVTGQRTVDEEAATSGRTLIWPYVIAEISKSPWIGYGRLAMKRTGLFDRIEAEYPGTGAPHPHNMYLETLFDNGILGSIPIFVFWGVVLAYSAALFRSSNRLYSAAGGLSFSLVFANVFAGISGQHVYPQEHTMFVWIASFLSLRIYVEDKRAQIDAIGPECCWSNPALSEDGTSVAPVHT